MKTTSSSVGFFALLIITLFSALTARATVLVGPVTNSANGHIYYLLAQSTWTAAEAEAVSMGGHLTTIRNDSENTWVTNTFGRYGGTKRCLWIGLNDAAVEGAFVWSSGESSSYRKWDSPAQPDNADNSDYVYIYPQNVGRNSGFWDDCGNNVIVGYGGSYGDVPLHGVVETIPLSGPVITSFAPNGYLTWTNPPATNGITVQWAPSVTGPWSTNWNALDSIITTGTQTTAAVPMFYRLSQGFTSSSARGTWIFGSSPPLAMGNMFFTCLDDGIIAESAMFAPQAPQGFFTVEAATGRVTNNFVFRNGGGFALAGSFIGPNKILFDPIMGLTNITAVRLDDPARCTGHWAGALNSTNSTEGAVSHPVSFDVDARGLLTGFVGFAGNPIGRFFSLSNGVAVAFVYTGEDYSTNGYNQIRLSGTLSGNNFQGVYHLDEDNHSPHGTVTLTR